MQLPRLRRQGLSVAGARLAIMTTQYYTASSIDGFIADSDNSLSWLFQFSEPSGMEDEFPRFIAKVGAIAMGSTTYEWIAQHTGFLTEPSKWRGVPDVLAGREGQAHPGRPVLQHARHVMVGRYRCLARDRQPVPADPARLRGLTSFGYSSSGGGGSVRSVSAMNSSSAEIGFRSSRTRAVTWATVRAVV